MLGPLNSEHSAKSVQKCDREQSRALSLVKLAGVLLRLSPRAQRDSLLILHEVNLPSRGAQEPGLPRRTWASPGVEE